MSITSEEFERFRELETKLQEFVLAFNEGWNIVVHLETKDEFPPAIQRLADKAIERSRVKSIKEMETTLKLEIGQLLGKIREIVSDYPEPTLEHVLPPDIPF